MWLFCMKKQYIMIHTETLRTKLWVDSNEEAFGRMKKLPIIVTLILHTSFVNNLRGDSVPNYLKTQVHHKVNSMIVLCDAYICGTTILYGRKWSMLYRIRCTEQFDKRWTPVHLPAKRPTNTLHYDHPRTTVITSARTYMFEKARQQNILSINIYIAGVYIPAM